MFGERPTAATITGVAIAVAGVGMLSGRDALPRRALREPRLPARRLPRGPVGRRLRRGRGPHARDASCGDAHRADALRRLVGRWPWCSSAIAAVTSNLAIPATGVPWVIGLAPRLYDGPLLPPEPRHAARDRRARECARHVGGPLRRPSSASSVFGETMAPIAWFGGALVVLGVVYPFLAQGAAAASRAMRIRSSPADASLAPRVVSAVALVLTNGGALLAVLEVSDIGLVLAWLGMIHLLRLGLAPLSGAFNHRFPRAIRWIGARASEPRSHSGSCSARGPSAPSPSSAYALAFGALFVDRTLVAARDRRLARPARRRVARARSRRARRSPRRHRPPRPRRGSSRAPRRSGSSKPGAIVLAAARGDAVHAGRPDRAGFTRVDRGVARLVRPPSRCPILVTSTSSAAWRSCRPGTRP